MESTPDWIIWLASGGYWVSTPADFIYAEPSTITGSIGVFGIIPSFQGTLQNLGIVAAARHKTPQQVDQIAQGRVWDGGTARQLGLVDGFGGMSDAIAKAAQLANLGN